MPTLFPEKDSTLRWHVLREGWKDKGVSGITEEQRIGVFRVPATEARAGEEAKAGRKLGIKIEVLFGRSEITFTATVRDTLEKLTCRVDYDK